LKIAVVAMSDPRAVLPDAADKERLVSRLRDAITRRGGSVFEIVPCPPSEPPCDSACERERASGAGAEVLVESEVLPFAGSLVVRVGIADLRTGAVIRTVLSGAVKTPIDLIDAFDRAIGECLTALHAHRVLLAAAIARSPSTDGTPASKIAIAPIAGSATVLQDPADTEILEAVLRAVFAERPGATYEVQQLPPSPEPCDRTCDISRAQQIGASHLVAPEIRQSAGSFVAIVEITDTATSNSAHSFQADAVAAPAALIGAVESAADDAADALFEILGMKPPTALAGPARRPPPVAPPTLDWRAGTSDFGGSMGVTGTGPKRYRAMIGIGIAMFAIGVVTTSIGGLLWGLGNPEAGIALAIVGDILWIPGLVIWGINNARQSKIRQGRPLLGHLRLEGLSPLVAEKGRGAPGLNARFSF
jgi:hypothetical protein